MVLQHNRVLTPEQTRMRPAQDGLRKTSRHTRLEQVTLP